MLNVFPGLKVRYAQSRLTWNGVKFPVSVWLVEIGSFWLPDAMRTVAASSSLY